MALSIIFHAIANSWMQLKPPLQRDTYTCVLSKNEEKKREKAHNTAWLCQYKMQNASSDRNMRRRQRWCIRWKNDRSVIKKNSSFVRIVSIRMYGTKFRRVEFFFECCAVLIYIDTNICGIDCGFASECDSIRVYACVFVLVRVCVRFLNKLSVCEIKCIWLLSTHNNDNHGSWHIISTAILSFEFWISNKKTKTKQNSNRRF